MKNVNLPHSNCVRRGHCVRGRSGAARWHSRRDPAGGLGVTGSTAGARVAYGYGAGQSEAEQGSLRWRHGWVVEEGLLGGCILQ
jgi:hypothetical protein